MTPTEHRGADPDRVKRAYLYRTEFLRQVHTLLARGYDRSRSAFQYDAEEETITGRLAGAIREVTEEPEAQDWVARYEVHDDPPQNTDGRTGRRRRRVDMELALVSGQTGKRPRFQFEAKRLYRSDSATEYLGEKGLGLFLNGAYAAGHPDAGMLGYVQAGEPSAWAEKIGGRLREGCGDYAVLPGGEFSPHRLAPELDDTYRSRHDRPPGQGPISIYHTLLLSN